MSPRRRSTDSPEHRRRRIPLALLTVVASALLAFALILAALALADIGDDTKNIQRSREESIRVSCQQQNQRHDATIRALDNILARLLRDATRQERRRLRTSRATTVLLINALAPKQDCERRVDRLAN